jgi:diguanylate cyclase (GGDEF)-like protein
MTNFSGQRDRRPTVARGNYILIAMPNVTRATAYRAAIDAADYEIVLARDGQEAQQELAKRGQPLLLILDLSLPKVDGFELLTQLRQTAKASDTAVVVVSGHATMRAAARRMAEPLDISRVLPADVDRIALREAVDAALNELNPQRRQPSKSAPVVAPASVHAGAQSIEDVIEKAVLAASRRFRLAVTIAYVKVHHHEYVRGYFAVSDGSGTPSAAPALAFLRQIAEGVDPLILPNVAGHPALSEIAPDGLPLIQGFAATPLPARGHVTGTLCVMDTKILQMGAAELDALDALGRDLAHDLAEHDVASDSMARAVVAPATSELDSLERLASADPLTGLANRRGGERDISAEISRARRQSTPLSCLLLDIDHFKSVNDTSGHQAGDYVLREISELLRRTVRAYDILVRWGGEEFLIVLPGVTPEQARKLAERLRLAVEQMPLSGIDGVTASIGVSALGKDYSFDAMFAEADRRLYAAKAAGRNRVA